MSVIRYERHLQPINFGHQCLVKHSIYPHWHEHVEILHCTEGVGSVIVGENFYPFKKGDTICVPSKCLHIISSDETLKCFCLILDTQFLKENGFDTKTFAFKEHFTDKKLEKLFKQSYSLFQKNTDVFDIPERRLSVLSIILYMCRNYSYPCTGQSKDYSKRYEAVLKAIDYMSQHYSRKLTLENIAEASGYSKYHFTRLFRNHTGVTVVQYLNIIRCNNARLLLKENTLPISEICSLCGFEHSSHFSKEFKRQYNITPSQYKKQKSKQSS